MGPSWGFGLTFSSADGTVNHALAGVSAVFQGAPTAPQTYGAGNVQVIAASLIWGQTAWSAAWSPQKQAGSVVVNVKSITELPAGAGYSVHGTVTATLVDGQQSPMPVSITF
jgi:hypothetical protein